MRDADDRRWPDLHEIWTAPDTALAAGDRVGYTARQPYVCPLVMPGRLELSVVSAAVYQSAGANSAIGLAIYRYDYRGLPRIKDPLDDLSSNATQRAELTLVAALPALACFGNRVSTIRLDDSLTLSPERGIYALAFCPGLATDQLLSTNQTLPSPRHLWVANAELAHVSAWPSRLCLWDTVPNVPSICLRSKLGAYLWGP